MSKKRPTVTMKRPTVTMAVMRYMKDTATWCWSPEAFALHGFDVGDVVPTTSLLLAHIEPEHRAAWAALLEPRSYACSPTFARLRRADGETRHVVGLRRHDCDGIIVDVADVTALVAAEGSRQATERITALAHSLATVEQAKGVLAAVYGVDVQSALAILEAVADRTGLGVNQLAHELMQQVATRDEPSPTLTDSLASLLHLAPVHTPGAA